jgi:hypothetical protein
MTDADPSAIPQADACSDQAGRISLLVGTPCTQTGITETFLHSVLALQRHCASLGWDVRIATRGDGLVTRTRNIFGSLMVSSAAYTHLLMIDADIGFDPLVVERLVRSGYDLVGACVPLREVKWDRVEAALKDVPDLQPNELQATSHGYAVSFLPDAHEGGRVSPVFGFLPVRFIGSAMLLASRRVFLELAESDQVSAYEAGAPAPDGENKGWTFFDPLVDPQGKVYLSEDYAFCFRWRALGGTVWADLCSRNTHSGVVTVVGDMALTLRTAARRSGGR